MRNKFSQYNDDQLEELFSNFLVDSWSYSKVGSFSRNEKEFEMRYIYRYASKFSASSVAGNAYHSALELFFNGLKKGKAISIVEMEQVAFKLIDNVDEARWKLQKTTPTVEDCKIKATKNASALIGNFYSEKNVYLSEVKEVIDVELKLMEWVCVNGVEVPLPCHAVLDLIVELKSGKIAVLDHKSKTSFSDEKDLVFTSGKQGITYVLCYEEYSGINVDEVWFIENKISKNRDKSAQLKPFKINMDINTRRLYEAQLYEPLKRMCEAISDPDYVYMINDNDNFNDTAEMYEFWGKTMMAEVDDFNIPKSKQKLISKRLKKIRDASLASIDPKIIKNFREHAATFITYDLSDTNMTKSEKIEHVLNSFGVLVQVDHTNKGFSSDTFLLSVNRGVKIASIQRYALDIANALDVSNVRIGKSLMVHEGKSYLPIEISKEREKTLYYDEKYLEGMKIPLGIDNFGNLIHWDLNNQSTPHMLICGATGSGKSVTIKSILEYAKLSGIKSICILDPKNEFKDYKGSEVDVFNNILDIEEKMEQLVGEMKERINSGESEKTLIIFDEFAHAFDSSRKGKDLKMYETIVTGQYASGIQKTKRVYVGDINSLEQNLKMLLQTGRSAGYKVVSATQRASVKVIQGDIKTNFPVRMCFRVPTEVDSKVVLDESGAETLSGAGDGLIVSPQYMDTVRFQGFYKP